MPSRTTKTGQNGNGGATPARRRSAASGGKPLVIVESPTKAGKIAGYLGNDYVVEASVGHIRDLPRNAADVHAKYKGEPWARLGVDTENDFEPLYVVNTDKRQQVSKLKAALKAEMEAVYALNVPLEVDIGIADNWADA